MRIQTRFFYQTLILLALLSPYSLSQANSNGLVDDLVNSKQANVSPKFSAIFAGRGDGVTRCPVTGEKITSKKLKAEMFGRTVYFCCLGCLKQAKAAPDKFVKPTFAEQQQAVKALLAKAKVANAAAVDSAEFCNE